METTQTFKSQAARDAQASGYGGPSYAEYLEASALELADFFRARGDDASASLMLTRSIGEALMGNDGD